jgi:hypothetical protein
MRRKQKALGTLEPIVPSIYLSPSYIRSSYSRENKLRLQTHIKVRNVVEIFKIIISNVP